MITAILIFLSAACWAAAQVLDRHFFKSIFKNLPPQFWYMHQSWKNALKIFWYRVDAWHLFQSAAVVMLITAIVIHDPVLQWYYEIVIGGMIWNISFSLFYHKILR
jgi:hypothetical protein